MHRSALGPRFVRDPLAVVSVGDTVTVRVLSVDRERGRIALSMRDVSETLRRGLAGVCFPRALRLSWISHKGDRALGPPASCRPTFAGWKPAVPEQPPLITAHE